ncbi:hypothetical protein GCM10011521_21020 [Arenimonas soli]|uniref:Uncharacterized protein n=1 Tax=Arenimonas soli TaxID=2269504 RepID=A0ABQ1HNL1_9GAMM|nr:hypothetical protein [Arenimonas soli]GGA82474.1 hypothetical protein GCM10011521_21020 [Arenimonas soli]
MKSTPLTPALGLALAATLALAGCKKDEATPPPVVTQPAPAPAPAPVAATVSVTGVTLGTDVDADGRVIESQSRFTPNQAITASVSTNTSDPVAAVAGSLSAKWLYQDGQVVNEESNAFSFAGPGTTNFRISKPDGWPVGRYTLEVSLDGRKVETREFTVVAAQ